MYPKENSNGQAGMQSAQDPFTTKLAEFHGAKVDFDSACHRLAEAQSCKAQAEQRLAAASKVISDLTANALNDPTVPQTIDKAYPQDSIGRPRY